MSSTRRDTLLEERDLSLHVHELLATPDSVLLLAAYLSCITCCGFCLLLLLG